MRALVLAGLALAACRISDAHFTGPGVGDDDASIDSPPSPGPAAYLIDASSGVYVLSRDTATGELSFTSEHHDLSGARSSAIDSGGHNLYVVYSTGAQTSSVHRYTIDANGSLHDGGDTHVGDTPMNCDGDHVAIAPNGSLLAVGCGNAFIAMLPRMSDGTIGAAAINETASLDAPRFPIFSTDSQCLYVADGAATGNNVFAFTANPDGTLVDALGSPYIGLNTPSAIIATTPKVFVAGNGQVHSYLPKASCALQLNVVQSVSDVILGLAVDQGRLYAAGAKVSVFDASMLTELPGSPFLDGSTGPFTNATFAPSPAGILYLTSATMKGTMAAHVDGTGVVTQGTSTSSPNTANAIWLQLGS